MAASRLESADPPPARAPISVLVLTRNEEANIGDCLAGLTFSDDVVVLDSDSTDRTVEIARQFPFVRVVRRAFDTEYKQRNFGLHGIEYRHAWLYICDADERVPDDLRAEIAAVAAGADSPHAAYRLRYKNMYLGRWIKHASGYPVWIIRLVRPARVTYEVRETNVHPVVDGSVGELRGHFVHYSFNSGLTRWFAKHNFYSEREAIEGVKIRRQGLLPWLNLRHRDPMVRRRAMKNLSYFLRARDAFRFLHTYVWRGGWMDGAAGFHYCCMIAMYEYWIGIKMRERELPGGGASRRSVRRERATSALACGDPVSERPRH